MSLAEQGRPLPPIVREVIPLQSSLELVFLVVSFLGLVVAAFGLALARRTLGGGLSPLFLRLSGRNQQPLDASLANPVRHLSDSAPGYDVIHDATYLRRIQEADESSRPL